MKTLVAGYILEKQLSQRAIGILVLLSVAETLDGTQLIQRCD